jgi:hypothetical protein
MKTASYFSPCININSKLMQDLSARTKNLKQQEKNRDNTSIYRHG